jgi:tetrapyrrole methylase family protein/MazG family protein
MNFDDLINIVAKLRSPEGCPWDKEQTRETLKPYLFEEFYELIDAMEDNDSEGTREELGDLLFQVVLQSQLSKEDSQFDINDVVNGIAQKMVRRHPHVFGGKDLNTSSEVSEWWAEHKRKEGKTDPSAIGGVPHSLPALIRASQLQRKATSVGFDWEKIEDVIEKLDEELAEFKNALIKKNNDDIEDEIGDILFVLVRIANFVNVNPEDALRRTIRKFIQRFNYIENEASQQGKRLPEMTLEEMDVLWKKAKEEL